MSPSGFRFYDHSSETCAKCLWARWLGFSTAATIPSFSSRGYRSFHRELSTLDLVLRVFVESEQLESVTHCGVAYVKLLGKLLGFPAVLLHQIAKARPLKGYRVWLRFADGVEGEVSLAHLVGRGVFKVWNSEEVFEQLFIDPESGALAWPGGIDLAPDALHKRISDVSSPTSFSA